MLGIFVFELTRVWIVELRNFCLFFWAVSLCSCISSVVLSLIIFIGNGLRVEAFVFLCWENLERFRTSGL